MMAAKLKHRWSVSHNYLNGITASGWWRLLRENRFAVDPVYWHRAAVVTLTSFINSWFAAKEERLHGKKVRATPAANPPLFILGHWRSGTTHLHNLIAEDTQFAYANTYQVVNPHTFLTTEDRFSKAFAFMVPKKRPMDNMALSFEAPQEDEFALLLESFRSLYIGVSFPRRQEHYERYLTFKGVPQHEIDEWKAALLWFTKKLTYKCAGKAIVFKSPPHTARIKLILEVFPDAHFVHIHRNPYDVFRSMRHYFDTAAWHMYMQRPDLETMDETILSRYAALHDAFFEQRELIPPGRFHEVRFTDLEQDPMGQMETLYGKLGLEGFTAFRPKLQTYVNSLAGYKKNVFRELPPEQRDKVASRWRRCFDAWGYAL